MKSNDVNLRHSLRLKDYDYSTAGAYFITICTQNRKCLFGQIPVGAGPCACPPIVVSDAGGMVANVWNQIPARYAGVDVDEFIVMPNHVHGIIVIGNVNDKGVLPRAEERPQGAAHTGLTLPDIVHRFKTMTTKLYADGVKQSGWQPFDGKLWQRNYYEHVIRSEGELNEVRQYIRDNPLKWALDSENPEFAGGAIHKL